MPRSTALPLRLENLETRLVPAMFGVPWIDATALQYSVVPDGTMVDGAPSTLAARMQANGLSESVWQGEIARAIQTWSSQANLNIGLTGDDGSPVATIGADQGDPRFGEIRISSRPISGFALAITTPPGLLGGTRAGDIVLNSHTRFNVGGGNNTYDLYSVMLQEVGHALGIGNSSDRNSPMYESYNGIRTGITAADGDDLRAMYGPRAADTLEGWSGNNSFYRASSISLPYSLYSSTAPYVKSTSAEMSTTYDADYFKFTVPSNSPGTIAVTARASGLSLLKPKITVYAADMVTVVGTATAETSLTNDATAMLDGVRPGQRYYVKVEKGSALFSVGTYQVQVGFNAVTSVPTDAVVSYTNDSGTNETTATASSLSAVGTFAPNSYYKASARLSGTSDLDFYKVRSPLTTAQSMTILMRAADSANPFRPRVDVFSSSGLALPVQVLVTGNGEYVVQVLGTTPNADYFVRATGTVANGQVANYLLNIDFLTPTVAMTRVDSGTLTATAATRFGTLWINRPQVLVLNLAVTSATANASAYVRVTVYDSFGRAVADFAARGGNTITTELFLGSGRYVVRVRGVAGAGQTALPPLGYNLSAAVITDPIGPTMTFIDLTGLADWSWEHESSSIYTNSMFIDPVGPPMM